MLTEEKMNALVQFNRMLKSIKKLHTFNFHICAVIIEVVRYFSFIEDFGLALRTGARYVFESIT